MGDYSGGPGLREQRQNRPLRPSFQAHQRALLSAVLGPAARLPCYADHFEPLLHDGGPSNCGLNPALHLQEGLLA